MLAAQRYPDLYDGILAIAPAIDFTKLVPTGYWAQVVMLDEGLTDTHFVRRLIIFRSLKLTPGYYPDQCEFEALLAATIRACDKDDGVKDGLISAPDQCNFDPQRIVGESFSCDGKDTKRRFSHKLANIAQKFWNGPTRPDGTRLWHGFAKGAPFSGVANTGRHGNGSRFGVPFPIPVEWFRDFIMKDPTYDATSINVEKFAQVRDSHSAVDYSFRQLRSVHSYSMSP